MHEVGIIRVFLLLEKRTYQSHLPLLITNDGVFRSNPTSNAPRWTQMEGNRIMAGIELPPSSFSMSMSMPLPLLTTTYDDDDGVVQTLIHSSFGIKQHTTP